MAIQALMVEGFRIASLHVLPRNEGKVTQIPAWYLKGEGSTGGDLYVIQTSTILVAPSVVTL